MSNLKDKNDSADSHTNVVSEQDVARFFTGAHEVQECLEGEREIDLQMHLVHCTKNPGHAGFISVKALTTEHFPSGYQDNELLDFIKATAELTVRVAVEFTSPGRPEFVPDTDVPYPCCKLRGSNRLHTGTGMVGGVIKYTEGMNDYRTCPCPDCDSDKPCKEWWEVKVLTARHVVFDTKEARKTSCRLWFDDDTSPVVKIYGWKVSESDTGKDMCWLHCVTHDIGIGTKLEEMDMRFTILLKQINDKYMGIRNKDNLVIIVSHPHGCSKQVSVGHWVHREIVGQWKRFAYKTSTCPGSSGALVYRLGWWSGPNHSGANSELNFSGLAVE
ncbi:uncharacterized protein LOC131943913 [Physella acuta]|uniref:uncharacterized protein LOC131943913 n=1 Tax=Physella acuta TaxID=109671 RepID=UPI0027DE6D85|nr:uncharacterized protein LOC131943913 [Physella acuta]XP_059160257.1 uncharacterized protein LOC131943913 [Physella acuta]XP_059160264.1 uncharacterized protein LOC131943913 [Physella acuta]